MKHNLGKIALAAALAATCMTAVPAQAHGRGGDATGAAIAGGVIGLIIGSAIASDRGDRYYYDDGPYYPRGVYYRTYPRYYYDRDYPRHWDGWQNRGWERNRGWDHDRGRDRGWRDRGWQGEGRHWRGW